MIGVEDLVDTFRYKLAATGSMDAALTKAVWVAYKKGYDDGIAAAKSDHMANDCLGSDSGHSTVD